MERKVCRMLDVYFPSDITDIIYDYSDGFKINTLTFEYGDSGTDVIFILMYNKFTKFFIYRSHFNESFKKFVTRLKENKTCFIDEFGYNANTHTYYQNTCVFFDKYYQGTTTGVYTLSMFKIQLSDYERLSFAKTLSRIIYINNNKK